MATQLNLPIENLDPNQISNFLNNLPIFLPSLQRLLNEISQNNEIPPTVKSIHNEITNSLEKLKTHSTKPAEEKSPDYAPIFNKSVFSRSRHKQGMLLYRVSNDEVLDWLPNFVRVRENIIEIFQDEPDKDETEVFEKPLKSITLATSFTLILEGSQAGLEKPNSFAIRLRTGKDSHDECFACSTPLECRHWLEALQVAQTQSETVEIHETSAYEGQLPQPSLHYEIPRQNLRRESFSRISRASSYEKMSDDTPIHDLNTSQDKRLYGRFRNLFTRLKIKERAEVFETPKNIDISILTPSTSTMVGILNVKFYLSNESQAFWSILNPPNLSLYGCFDKIATSTPDSIVNILEFDFQQGPPSEFKFKLLHNLNSNQNIKIETSMHEYQAWAKKIKDLINSKENEYEIEDDDVVIPVYDVPKSEPRATSIVLSDDNEVAAIYDVPSKKPRPVEKPIGKREIVTSPENEDMYDVPSNRPVIPPRPNFSYGSVYSDSESPPGTPNNYDHPKAPVAVNGNNLPIYDQPRKPVPVNGNDISEMYDHPKPPVPVMKSLPALLYDQPKAPVPVNAKSNSVTYDLLENPTRKIKELPPALPAPRRDMPVQKAKSSEEIRSEVSEKIAVGGVLKLSTDVNQWTKFYFTLRGRFLQAFDDVTPTLSPILVLDISGSEFFYIPPDESKRKYCFSICTSSLSFNFFAKSSKFSFRNIFIFAAETFSDFNAWRTAIFDVQGVYNLSTKSTSQDQLAHFGINDPPKRSKPIRRVFSSVLKRESKWYAEVEQKFVPQDHVYVVKPKSKSISIPVSSRNSEKIYSRIFESNIGKKPDNSVLSSSLSIFSGLEWKTHWFELRNKILTCFENQESIRTIFEIALSQCCITEASKETNREFSFKLAATHGDIVYFFCAENVNIYTEWITSLMMNSIQIQTRFGNASESSQTSQASLQNGSLGSEEILKSPPKLKGNLLKRTSNGKWEQRYCIVKEGVMLTYKSNQATPLQRLILIDALVNVCNSLEVSQNHAFEIRIINSDSSHFFAAFSHSKLEEWLNGLRSATTPKPQSNLEDSIISPEKSDFSQASFNSTSTPDLKNTRPPKPVRSESLREYRAREDRLPAAHLQNPIKSGVLDYRPLSSKVWGRRFCIIHDLCLYIYLHPSSEHPQKVFALPACEIKSSLQETSKFFSFSIEHRGMKAFFSTQILKDLQIWIEMLTKIALIHASRDSAENLQGSPEVILKIHTSTPNQNGKGDNKFEQIQKIISQSNKDIFDTYSHSNMASTNLRNSIESLQKKRKNLQIHLSKQKQLRQKDVERIGKIRELLQKYDEAIEEFHTTAEHNKIETTNTIVYLEMSREKSLKEIKSLFQSNSDLSLSQEIRGILHTSESGTLI